MHYAFRSLAAAALLAVVAPQARTQTLMYQGDYQGGSVCSVKGANLALGCTMYDNFAVAGNGWNVTSVFGNFFQADVEGMAPWTSAYWEIRTGMSAGNTGSLLFGGIVSAATHETTGRQFTTSSATFNEFTANVNTGSFFLGAGSYWLGISPVVIETAASHVGAYASRAQGTNGINAQLDDMGIEFVNNSRNYTLGDWDFSYGLNGAVASPNSDPGTGPGTGPGASVPEPASLALVVTGLVGLISTRRKRTA